MLIGAIESVTLEEVAGWIYSPATELHGTLALAFVGGECVGSGRVEYYRPDLASAGLSHGKYGFHFPVALRNEAAVGSLVVRPEGCEAIIVQRGSRIVGDAASEQPVLVGGDLPSAETVAWLQMRQAVSKDEFEFLTTLNDFSVASWRVRTANSGNNDGRVVREEAALSVVQLCTMAGLQVGRAEFKTGEELAKALYDGDNPISHAGLLVFHADWPLILTVVEGSHRTPQRSLIPDALDHGIRYTADANSLLAVHRLCAFRLEQPHAKQFTVHYPKNASTQERE
jgi:hypothetical protein